MKKFIAILGLMICNIVIANDGLKFTYKESLLGLARTAESQRTVTIPTVENTELNCYMFNDADEIIMESTDNAAILPDEYYITENLLQNTKKFVKQEQPILTYELFSVMVGEDLNSYDATTHPKRVLSIELIEPVEFPTSLNHLPRSIIDDPMISFPVKVTLKEIDNIGETVINQEILTAQCGFYR